MADIFLSYKREEQADALRLIQSFEAAGFSVWWDDRIDPTSSWDETIEREITAAKAVVVLWTPLSTASDWVRTEAHFASNAKKLVPALLRPCTIPLAFSLTQAADLTRWRGDDDDRQWRKCLTWVSDLVQSHARRIGEDAPTVQAPAAAYGALASGDPVVDGYAVGPTTLAGTAFQDGPGLPVMRVMAAGRFQMGSPVTEKERRESEGPQHWVTIAQAFAIGVFPVTFREWDAIARDRIDHVPADQGWGRGGRPAVDVSWLDAVAFTDALSAQTGAHYRLPSEAEWEYACRARTQTPFPYGADLPDACAVFAPSQGTREVGLCAPNPFGLHDMTGNVREWVEDLWHNNYVGAPGDGSAWTGGDGSMRVVRGGGWSDAKGILRSAARGRATTTERSAIIGLRVCREL